MRTLPTSGSDWQTKPIYLSPLCLLIIRSTFRYQRADCYLSRTSWRRSRILFRNLPYPQNIFHRDNETRYREDQALTLGPCLYLDGTRRSLRSRSYYITIGFVGRRILSVGGIEWTRWQHSRLGPKWGYRLDRRQRLP